MTEAPARKAKAYIGCSGGCGRTRLVDVLQRGEWKGVTEGRWLCSECCRKGSEIQRKQATL